ncbi:MAG: hypothetical protein ACOY33_13865 [Pseudomonadota bacterium]
MSKLNKLNALAASVVVSALGVSVSHASSANPFAASDVAGGYQQLAGAEGACGNHGGQPKPEGKCGEGKCGEGKCGGDKAAGEGKCGEGKCGEGKCGGDKAKQEGKCGGEKAKKEGKCGEGKCGGDKAKQ